MRKHVLTLGFAFGVATFFSVPRAAHAGLEACGNIDVSADAHCEIVTQGGCTTRCTPESFELTCSAKLEQQCNSQCTTTATVDCTSSCESDCNTKCTQNPPQLDCKTDCSQRCEADCGGRCATSQNQADCQASCHACCGDKCDTQCTEVPGSTDCQTKCHASCQGSCTAKATTDCQVQCQAQSFEQCKSEMNGGCTTQCQKPEGALFCDGNYVDVGDNLQKCVDELNAVLNVKIQASATGQCSGNECNGQVTVKSTACDMAPGGNRSDASLAALGTFVVAALAGLRKRMKRA